MALRPIEPSFTSWTNSSIRLAGRCFSQSLKAQSASAFQRKRDSSGQSAVVSARSMAVSR
nr:hypothetical protein [Frondihabitans sucicola]